MEEDTTTSLGLDEVEFGPGRASEAGQTITYTIQSIPEGSEGSIQLSDGTPVTEGQALSLVEFQGLKFNPALNFNGDTAFSFTVSDSGTPLNEGGGSDDIYGDNLTALEISLKTDLSGDGVVGTTVNQMLTTSGGASMLNVYQSNSGGLLLSDSSSLPIGNPTALKDHGTVHKLLRTQNGMSGFWIQGDGVLCCCTDHQQQQR